MNFLSRFYRPSRKALCVAAAIVGVVVLIELIGMAAWWFFSQSRLGRLELVSGRAILRVEVLDESGEASVGEPITVVRKAMVTLPDGEYRLRLTSEGLLGRTYRTTVNRGETISVKLSLDEGRLLGGDRDPAQWNGNPPREDPMPFADETIAVELVPGKADIVEFTGQAIIRRDGVTGKVIWNVASPDFFYDREHDPGTWQQRIARGQTVASLVEPVVDLDGDGARDIVLVGSGVMGWIALSGKDGSKLWDHRLERPGSAPPVTKPRVTFGPDLLGETWIDDIDGDGAPELVVTIVFQESVADIQKRTGSDDWHRNRPLSQRVVRAISGRTGRNVWNFLVDPTFTMVKASCWDKPATLVRGRRSSVLAILDGSRWLQIRPRNGLAQGRAIDLGFEPVRPLQYGDLDGDGEPEIVALGPGAMAARPSLTAVSTSTGKAIWTAAVRATFPGRDNGRFAEWPWLIKLGGDARTDVIVPDSGPLLPAGGYRGIKMIDGISGETRWVRPMRPENKADDGLSHVVEATDLDGDGVGDLIAVSSFAGRNGTERNHRGDLFEPERAYADAISGRDGRLLWSWHADWPDGLVSHIGLPHWWGRGPDGRPLLAIPLGGPDPRQLGWPSRPDQFPLPTVHVLEASTGRERHRVIGLFRASVADMDGDGPADLWGEVDGQLRAFRGELPEIWRTAEHLAPATNANETLVRHNVRPGVDFDGDGTADALMENPSWSGDWGPRRFTGSRTASARSGRDGRLLWKNILDPPRFPFDGDPTRSYALTALRLPAGDLDGDGTSDVIVRGGGYDRPATEPARIPIQAISGRNGRPLWSAGPLRVPIESHDANPVTWFRPLVIEPNTQPDLLVAHVCSLVKSGSALTFSLNPERQHRLARLSGRTGRVVWDIALEDFFTATAWQPQTPTPTAFADADGDGCVDAAWLVPRTTNGSFAGFELKIISLRDGVVRWTWPSPKQPSIPGESTVEIVSSEPGRPAIVGVTAGRVSQERTEPFLIALNGRDGSVRWSWSGRIAENDHELTGRIHKTSWSGTGTDSILVTCGNESRQCRVLILDSQGREHARRDIPREPVITAYSFPIVDFPVDLDGDGRDELVVWNDNRLSAWGRDMTTRWSIPWKSPPSHAFLPAPPGGSCTLLLDPQTAVDGKTGQFRWMEKSPPSEGKTLLDPGGSLRLPLVLSNRQGTTVCRQALALTPQGDYAIPHGAVVPEDLIIDDPRWTRPLPWLVPRWKFVAGRDLGAAVALAIVNVFLPLGMLRLAAGGRAWRMWSLMVLPIAVAIPLWMFQAVGVWLPSAIGTVALSPSVAFIGGTLAGIPIVVLIGGTALYALRLRWRALAWLAGLTIVAAAIIAAIWLCYESRSMPAIEHYSRSGWPLGLVLGAYVAGALQAIGWTLTASYRLLTGGYRRAPDVSSTGPASRRDFSHADRAG